MLFSHTVRGRETAGRVAVRADKALLTDAVAVRRDAEGIVTDHQNFGGAYTATAAATHSAPIITVRPGAVADRAPAVEAPEVVELAAAELGPDATPREIDARWRRWYEANRRVIGDDPHLLLPGTVLTSPVFTPHAGVDGPRP